MGIADKIIGNSRCPGTSFEDIAQDDTNPVPHFLLDGPERYLGSEALSVDRYVSPAFFELELARMWPNVWQFAAREEEMLQPGQTVVYENAGRSYVLVRQADGSIKAFHNVCLHRGRKLCDKSGKQAELRCPFHSFTWNLDGSLKTIPCEWDFEHLRSEKMSLPEAEVGRWQGYIFVRENKGGQSIEEYLSPLSDHFSRFPHDECYTSAWYGKVVDCNWKVAQEAFMEVFHVFSTHPQLIPFAADANAKYMLLGEHVNLMNSAYGITSPHARGAGRGEQWLLDEFLKNNGRVVMPGTVLTVPEGGTARRTLADHNRERFGRDAGRDLSHISDVETLDVLTYNVFPNFSPWGGFAPNLVYRWRPWPDQDRCLMEFRVLQRLKPGEPMKPAVPMTMLDAEGSLESVLGQTGRVLDQDWANLSQVQAGMKVSKNRRVELGNYQEVRIRHFHQLLDKYLAS